MTARSSLTVQVALPLALAAALVSGCGGGEQKKSDSPTASEAAELQPVKDYLLDHTQRLVRETGTIRAGAERLHSLAEAAGFDYAQLMRTKRAEVSVLVRSAQAGFRRANPAYEEMEGVVAGVPELADYDVIIDAGGDASDPENAVPFSIKTPKGRTFKQPGNFNYLIETSAYGTEPKFAAQGVEPDLDGDGRVEFGEALPDADFYVAAARDFEKNAKELDAAAHKWEPTPQDAFTALVVMTPTMSEYFEAWKNSRFVAGGRATEKAFVAASRLQDIVDILGGLELVYDGVDGRIESVDPEQARQTGRSLSDLRAFASKLRKEEAGGRRFTAEQAETLGSEAQSRAEAIAGQISQAAGKLDIDLEN
jgi:PAS domain-containing protein